MIKNPSVPVSGAGPARKVSAAGEVSEVAGASGVDAVEEAAAAPAVGAVEKLAPVGAVARVSGAEEVTALQRLPPVAAARVQEIAGRLRRGELSAAQAVDALINDAVSQQLGAAAAEGPISVALREALLAHLQGDPQLSVRMRRLARLDRTSPQSERGARVVRPAKKEGS